MALPKQSEDFPSWYQEVVKQADLAENSLVRGTMVIKPYGYAIWEGIQRAFDDRIKATGHRNFMFPMFFPYSLLEREAEHVEGFAPEVALVTHAGGEKLEEPLVVRPTSETIIWHTYAKWVQSYRDLPLLYNQWCNVVRWELRPAGARSGGVSTRLVGGLIMAHGDDRGLRLPPDLAPYQVVVIPIYRSEEERTRVLTAVRALVAGLVGIRVHVDDRDDQRPGFKFNEWELKGVPIRLDVGPRDLDADQVTAARRDTGEKLSPKMGTLGEEIPRMLERIQRSLYEDAERFRDDHTFAVSSFDELRSALEAPGGFVVG